LPKLPPSAYENRVLQLSFDRPYSKDTEIEWDRNRSRASRSSILLRCPAVLEVVIDTPEPAKTGSSYAPTFCMNAGASLNPALDNRPNRSGLCAGARSASND